MEKPIEKSLLLTISDDHTASSNLRFIDHFFGSPCEFHFTLFYVAPRSSVSGYDPLDPGAATLLELDKRKRSKGHEYLEIARSWLASHMCDPSRVKKKLIHTSMGPVPEIIHEGHQGMYDAVVLGRRGLGWFTELVEDSVSHQILWRQIDFPIWICREHEFSARKNVLLCLGDAGPSIRMADHVGFMLSGMDRHRVTLFHVDNGKMSPDEAERVFEEARGALLSNHIDESLIDRKVVKAKSAADTILKESVDNDYAVVAVGRQAGAPSAMDKLFPGSVSTSLLRKITRSALWVSK
ncbi:universal stress protein [Desulfovibrio inopinatus]|uniref:universal stress protein n=1 Tax=Desulfovibrio inopinatus TaxID=102109 RepID=UPI000410E009|nr:universal stress protein [Desulfovibrio inopinatus]